MRLDYFRQSLNRKQGQRDQIQSDIDKVEKFIEDLKSHLENCHEAQLIIQTVARETQQELEYRIGELVSLAMSGVFEERAYEAVIDFVIRRSKTEADIYYKRDGYKIRPKSGGGGAVDVGGWGFRVSLFHLKNPKPRNVLLLDEPFRHLKGEKANERALKMVRQISHRLNLQVIMVSDERTPRSTIVNEADRVFEVKIKNGRSYVEVL